MLTVTIASSLLNWAILIAFKLKVGAILVDAITTIAAFHENLSALAIIISELLQCSFPSTFRASTDVDNETIGSGVDKVELEFPMIFL